MGPVSAEVPAQAFRGVRHVASEIEAQLRREAEALGADAVVEVVIRVRPRVLHCSGTATGTAILTRRGAEEPGAAEAP